MKTKNKKLLSLAVIVLFFFVIASVIALTTPQTAYAADIESIDNYTFKLITDDNGEQSYSIAIKASAKPGLEYAIIPEKYNGLYVTEIANNGFMACTNLKKVILPTSIKKIGSNAFMNNSKLERITLPNVESIGMNAFALCPLLDRVFIPYSVKSVGANILRNNKNTVYVQSNADTIASEWQSTWSSYFTGDIVYSADPEDIISYREILDEQGINVVGYELTDQQYVTAGDSDIVIYNAVKTDENADYLPLLNICSEAFVFSQANSITIKDIRTIDQTAPVFTHEINIRSNAFIGFWGNEVNFEIPIAFNHPKNLDSSITESVLDQSEITCDANENSIKIFEESTVKSVLLPNNLDFITERMFYNCPYLENIEFFDLNKGSDNNENTSADINTLTGIERIGSEAFSSCVSISSITLPSSVQQVGNSVFYAWGDGDNTQTINIDMYKDSIPSTWSSDWFDGNAERAFINYKQPKKLTVDLQDGSNSFVIDVKPNIAMPAFEKPERTGYIFKGIYSEPEGSGFQYYTDDMQVAKIWKEGDNNTLYVYWIPVVYTIDYVYEGAIENPNPTSYTVEDDITLITLKKPGYSFAWSMSKINKGTVGNLKITGSFTIINYTIAYVGDLKGLSNPNPTSYTIEDSIVFQNLEHECFSFIWNPSKIENGTTGNITIQAVYTPKKFEIQYKIKERTVHSNPNKYTYGEELILSPATLNGYFVTWDRVSIPAGTKDNVTVTAKYTEKTLDQCYNNGIYEIWTWNQFEQLRNQPNGGYGRTYKLMKNVHCNIFQYTFKPIDEFKGTFDGNNFSLTQFDLDCSTDGNIGLFRVNYGTIKNLTLGTRYSIYSTHSNVNAGFFSGINKGIISNCHILAVYNIYIFYCTASGDSYAGGIAGINEGTIENSSANDEMYGSCNMGLIAGKSSGTIKNCSSKYSKIEFVYNDYNACLGGIVGLQTAGKVTNCSFNGNIAFLNYHSQKYPKSSENREMQPCAGTIIGRQLGGTSSNNIWSAYNDSIDVVYPSFYLTIVTWKQGLKKYSIAQRLYFRCEECGRIG